jgi:predicted acetyltransferase
MAMELRWVGIDQRERVAEARMRAFAVASKELARFKESIPRDHGTCPTEFLLAEVDGEAVGTATPLALWMWVRGNRVPCQGVAYVGTSRTSRRSGGIASKMMWEVLRVAREREQVISALMPFRASYYEHFGYGIVERRIEWALPLAVLPRGDCSGMRFYRSDDLAALSRCKQPIAEAGQCDIERTASMWDWHIHKAEEGFLVIDGDTNGPLHGWMRLYHESEAGRDRVRVSDSGYDSPQALLRQLHFLASQCDQYSSALLTLPADVPLNWLLKETQLPHRPVNHTTAQARPYTQTQVRVLDHKKLIEGIKIAPNACGAVVVNVKESEGHESKFRIEVEGERAAVQTSQASAGFECPDHIWAAVICGDLPASDALRYGLASGSAASAAVLDVFAFGPKPFCREYF